MSNYKSAYDESSGSPNLEAVQYTQENWGKNEIVSALRVEKVSVTASGSSGVEATTIPVGAEIMDVVVHPTVNSGGGTAKISVGNGGADVTNAIPCAVEDTIGRATSIDQTYKIVTTDGIDVITNDDADKGDVYIYYKK